MSVRPLIDIIRKAEAPQGYDQLSSYMESRVGKHPLTEMTVKEVLDLQKRALLLGTKSTAVGQYQILRKTLLWLAVKLDLKAEEVFDAEFQDELALTLMDRRGLSEFLRGDISITVFANNLAKEWAGLPVVSEIKGWNGTTLEPGLSYYSGDKLNKATVSPEELLTALNEIKRDEVPQPPTVYKPPWSDTMFGRVIWPIIFGQLRHLLTAFGGFLIATGVADADQVESMIGGVMAAVGVILSAYSKLSADKG